MSVTFHPEGVFQKTERCACMVAYMEDHVYLEGHNDCPGYIPLDDVPELNISSDNAGILLDLLGFSKADQQTGLLSATDVLVSIAYARIRPLVEHTRSASVSGANNNVYDCPLTEEQILRYLDLLADVANYALERELGVSYV